MEEAQLIADAISTASWVIFVALMGILFSIIISIGARQDK